MVPKDVQDFEDELDSQKGNTSDSDEKYEVLEEAQEIEELKIQDCLLSFFNHIEEDNENQTEYPNESWKPQRPQTAVRSTVIQNRVPSYHQDSS